MASSTKPPVPHPTPAQIAKRIASVREAFHRNAFAPIVLRQIASSRDVPAKGSVWVSRVSYQAPPENALQKVLLDAIAELGDGTEQFDIPEVGRLEAQWVGWRGGVGKNEPELQSSAQVTYDCMMKEVENDIVVLFCYGGGFMLGGPATRRPLCSQLARLTKGRCYIPRYRLAPQNPFPAALLDILHAYLTLISPPPGSLHAAVAPSSIVFAGDSAGACIVLAVVQILLSFARTSPLKESVIPFHGQEVKPQLPAGVAIVSLVGDMVLTTPSWSTNAATDVFDDEFPPLRPGFPSDSAWPTNPPRGHVYSESLTLAHPLVSLCTTPPRCWRGAPPLWISMGDGERLLDSAKIVVKDILNEGGRAQWVEVEQMPHLFIGFQDWWQGKKIVDRWAFACKAMVNKGKYESGGVLWCVDQSEKVVDLTTLTMLRNEDVLLAMRKKVSKMKVWTGEEGTREKIKL